MRLLTEDAVIRCGHVMGKADVPPTQELVRVNGRRLLVENDPEGRPIKGCPNVNVGIKPCTHTLVVKVGYSALLRVNGKRVCLDSLSGFTDGTPPGVVKYLVRPNEGEAGQEFVRAAQ
jgi:hypothetical protein